MQPSITEWVPPGSMAAVTDVCPSEADEPSYDEVVALGKIDQQGALRDDVRILSEYGAAHPETFGSVRYGWNSSGDSLMIIALTGELDGPRGVLDSLVAHPQALVVCRAALTETELHVMRDEIEARMTGQYSGFGEGAGTLLLELFPGDEAIAAELHEQYGDALELRVGGMPYPMTDELPSLVSCGAVPEPPADQAGVTITLDPLAADPRIGSGTTTKVHIVNFSEQRLTFSSDQPLTAGLVRPGSSQIIGVYTGMIAGTGLLVDLEPGTEMGIDVLVSAASCDPALGYVLPAGDYEMVATIPRYGEPTGEGTSELSPFVSDRLSVRLD